MRTKRTICKGYLLVQVYDGERLVSEREYIERRCGIAWPTINSPGYACIFGLYKEPEPRRLRLLWELEEQDRSKLISKTVVYCQHLAVRWAFADLSGEYEGYEMAWYNHCKRRNVQTVQLHDVHDISGIERTWSAIDDLTKQRLLRMTRRSLLYAQGLSISPDTIRTIDNVKPHERWYAVHALSHVVASYDYFPFSEDKKKPATNTGSRPGYG